MPAKPHTLGEHLKQARVEKGLTIKQAGQKMGVHYRSIVIWESDRCRPKPRHLEVIRAFLGYDLPEIYRKSPKSQFVGYLPLCAGASTAAPVHFPGARCNGTVAK